MGKLEIISPFLQRFKHSETPTERTPLDVRSDGSEQANYYVYYDPSTDIESSLWVKIKTRKNHTQLQTNRIRTTRYNIFTFIPKNLFEQFHRIANIYFAILIGLNWVPVINAVSKTVTKHEYTSNQLMKMFFRLLSYRYVLF